MAKLINYAVAIASSYSSNGKYKEKVYTEIQCFYSTPTDQDLVIVNGIALIQRSRDVEYVG